MTFSNYNIFADVSFPLRSIEILKEGSKNLRKVIDRIQMENSKIEINKLLEENSSTTEMISILSKLVL